jgi:hypothetical protein
MTNTPPSKNDECQTDITKAVPEYQPPQTLPTYTNELGDLSLYGYELSSEAPLWNNPETHGVSNSYFVPPVMNAGEATSPFSNDSWDSIFLPNSE